MQEAGGSFLFSKPVSPPAPPPPTLDMRHGNKLLIPVGAGPGQMTFHTAGGTGLGGMCIQGGDS